MLAEKTHALFAKDDLTPHWRTIMALGKKVLKITEFADIFLRFYKTSLVRAHC
jgi:hypothetical protein